MKFRIDILGGVLIIASVIIWGTFFLLDNMSNLVLVLGMLLFLLGVICTVKAQKKGHKY